MTHQLRDGLVKSWLNPPWEWGPTRALGVFILVAAVVLLVERDRIVSIQIGGDEGVKVGMAFGLPEPFAVPPPGGQVEISAQVTGLGPITEPSTCTLTVLIPGQEPIRTGPEAVIEDGTVSWELPSEDFASVGETPVTADVTADCDVSDEDFEIATEFDFVSE